MNSIFFLMASVHIKRQQCGILQQSCERKIIEFVLFRERPNNIEMNANVEQDSKWKHARYFNFVTIILYVTAHVDKSIIFVYPVIAGNASVTQKLMKRDQVIAANLRAVILGRHAVHRKGPFDVRRRCVTLLYRRSYTDTIIY